jgi:hypothetical protein
MQNKLSKIISLALLSITLVVAGCKSTTPTGIAYKSLTTIAASVHVATDAYWNYRDANPGRVPNALDDKLKAAYQQYQQAFALAAFAEKSMSPGAPPVDTTAVVAAASAFTSLVSVANPNFKP